MVRTTTFKGAPKPPKSGWFYESRRHSLASKGVKTGNFQVSIIAPVQPHLKSSPGFKRILARIPTEERRKRFIKQFDSLTKKEQELVVTLLKDTDGDKAIDLFDCNPYNPDEQDLKEFLSKAVEKAKEGAKWVGEKVREGAEKVKEEAEKVGEKAKEGAEWLKEEASDIKDRLERGAQELTKPEEELEGAMPLLEMPEEGVEVIPEVPSATFKTEVEAPEGPILPEGPEPEAESITGEVEEPKPSFGQRIRKASRQYKEAFERERQQRLARLEGEEVQEEEQEPVTVAGRLGVFLADLSAGYSSEELAGLSNKELELLAIRFKTQFRDGIFGVPENPFTEELRKRIEAQEELKQFKAEVMREIHQKPKEEKGLLADFFGFDEPKKKPGEKGPLAPLFG